MNLSMASMSSCILERLRHVSQRTIRQASVPSNHGSWMTQGFGVASSVIIGKTSRLFSCEIEPKLDDRLRSDDLTGRWLCLRGISSLSILLSKGHHVQSRSE